MRHCVAALDGIVTRDAIMCGNVCLPARVTVLHDAMVCGNVWLWMWGNAMLLYAA